MIVGKTFPLRLDLATCTRELSCILVPDPICMLFASPEIEVIDLLITTYNNLEDQNTKQKTKIRKKL
jgi:hypothetical protein